VGGWRRLHNEELFNLYASQNIRVIKSRWLKWAGNVAKIRDKKMRTLFLLEMLQRRHHLEDLGVHRGIC